HVRVGHRQLSIPESPLNLIVEGLFFVQRLRFIGFFELINCLIKAFIQNDLTSIIIAANFG
ncbi:hypothetical protein, partial [uncultured Psychrobacter sp.]|uniref:hypothetical protein n=1 Tax=uncultured Psychrobacter sp. TaxID=259303 RepID=UPI0026369F38